MKRILLLNPPGDKIYFRDYYCSKVSKASYYYHPLDLLYLSGWFNKPDFDLHVIDAIADKLSVNDCLKKVKVLSPDIILSLISSPSYGQDLEFLKEIKDKLPDTTLAVTGDVCRELKEKTFATHSFINAVLLDFSTDDFLKYAQGGQGEKIQNVVYQKDGQIIAGQETHSYGEFNIPLPKWDLFHLDNYSFPFSRRKKFATILTDFGCPYKCSFCPISTLGFKLRPIDSVIEELKQLQSLNVRELFIRDQTFGVNKDRTIKLCQAMNDKNLDFSWTCFSRVDVIDEEILKTIKKAGCHTIMFGVESSNKEILKNYNKDIAPGQIKQVINLCREFKIRTVGTFILGLPGETRRSTLETIAFAKSLGLDYASFNVGAPLFGTSFRKEVIDKGWVNENEMEMESAKGKPVWKNQPLSNDEIVKLRKYAVRSFYLRPKYIMRRLLALRSLEEIRQSIKEALSIFN